LEEGFNLGLQLVQIQEDVLCVPGDGGRSVEFTSRVLEFKRIQEPAAQVALIATSVGKITRRQRNDQPGRNGVVGSRAVLSCAPRENRFDLALGRHLE